MLYAIAPFIGWFVAGVMKFCVNYLRFGSEARDRIGNGGFPSNHTTIMTTTVMLIGFREGFATPMFGLGVAVTYIVIIDAMGLRRHVGRHATHLNRMNEKEKTYKKLRESMGHNGIEVLGGLVLGSLLGYVLSLLPW
ncbi:divergent PAP2 family protein [Aneurinibacillus aneurinilyticus]|uniref:divergent PAP2 family protein n=1 Tax=Aneurinibacillus aneurinilyticus TaxID=1391 RepID=UPI003672014C